MEDDKELLTVLKNTLKVVVTQLTKIGVQDYVTWLSKGLLMPERLQEWLYGKQLPDFTHFHFIESKSFEPINQNYWKVVHEPVG